MEQLARLGEQDAVLVIKGQGARGEALQPSGDIDHLVTQVLEHRLVQLDTGSACLTQAGEKVGCLLGGVTARVPDEGEIKVVAKQVFTHHAFAIFVIEAIRKSDW